MNQTYWLLLALFCAAQAIVVLSYLLYKAKKHPPPQKTQDAQELLAAIASGDAVLKIKVINPEHLFIRSPKE